MITLYAEQKKRHRFIEQSFRLCGRRRGWDVGTASKHVYYQGWNRSPAQVGCMRQVLGPGALGRPRGIGWRGRWEGGLGWGTHVNPWLIHFNVWQKPLQCCKVISLQLIKIKKFKKKHKHMEAKYTKYATKHAMDHWRNQGKIKKKRKNPNKWKYKEPQSMGHSKCSYKRETVIQVYLRQH